MEASRLAPLLDPESVAIVGASPKAGWPGRIWANLERFGYRGRVYPVNPRYESLWGLKCYPGLEALPEVVDNAVIIVPAPAVVELLGGDRPPRFRSATILAGGFGEGGDEEGRRRCERLRDFAARWGVPVTGPNCMGLASARSRAVLFPDLRMPELRRGGLAIVSQSGGLVGALVRALFGRGLGVEYFVSSGNEAVTDVTDYFAHFVDDEGCRLLVAILEGLRSARRFLEVAEKAARAGKPIVVLKVGRSPKGASAALAHTGALAGNDLVFRAAASGHGVTLVDDLDELINTAELFLRVRRFPAGRRAGFITFSGGLRAFLADLAHDAGLPLPELSPETEEALRGVLGVGTALGNPLDTGWSGLSSQESYLKCVETMLADPSIDMVAIQEELPQSEVRPDKESNLLALASLAEEHPKPVAVFAMSGQSLNDYARRFKERCALPFLDGAQNAVKALKRLGDFASARAAAGRRRREPAVVPLSGQALGLLRKGGVLSERETYRLLAEYGIEPARSFFAPTAAEAASAAAELGYPVALKGVASGLTHKSDLGVVKLSIRDAAELAAACREIESRLEAAGKPLEAFLVQEMIEGGVETIIGAIRDEAFGAAVMFGLGGVHVEVYRDVVFRLAPVSEEEAAEMIRSVRGYALLEGFRGRAPVDVGALARAIVSVSLLAKAGEERIDAIDVNPFLALPEGGKAVDAVIVVRGRA